MSRAAKKQSVALLVLLLICIGCYGCGTGDLLDDANDRYRTDLSFEDGDQEDILTIDIFQANCSDDNGTITPEIFTNLFANIDITAIEDAPSLTMTGYKITFTPLNSTDDDNNVVTPPTIRTVTGTYDVFIESNATTSFFIEVMEIDTKDYMESFLPPCTIMGSEVTCPDVDYRYEVGVRMDFLDENLQPEEITIRRTIFFGRYNNC